MYASMTLYFHCESSSGKIIVYVIAVDVSTVGIENFNLFHEWAVEPCIGQGVYENYGYLKISCLNLLS